MEIHEVCFRPTHNVFIVLHFSFLSWAHRITLCTQIISWQRTFGFNTYVNIISFEFQLSGTKQNFFNVFLTSYHRKRMEWTKKKIIFWNRIFSESNFPRDKNNLEIISFIMMINDTFIIVNIKLILNVKMVKICKMLR